MRNKKENVFLFKTNDGFYDYFNPDGKNVKKSLMITPIDGAKLSSSYGFRKHPILGYNKLHKGVDFAAPKGLQYMQLEMVLLIFIFMKMKCL